ncbi:hypothetical protein SAMN05421638_0259 [Kaistella treverensis]|uniref:Uncharacterized protein n=1 Tax=Kaistella treverensis TaxID=631455 RepID=A0A1I3JLQ2_9FLAO|nr:hypothetical protein [Kaistella treverensis]SFI61202.1 hypothetical protein SAMN05421638_0259 [Kaistella treverensis]
MPHRFQDQNHRLSHFQDHVDVVCRGCGKNATATADHDKKEARMYCLQCGYSKTVSTSVEVAGIRGDLQIAAHEYFGAKLWFAAPFKSEEFFAFNREHLDYLEAYISATLREHTERSHFTLLEKLPRFYHEAKNREALLKLIAKLKTKK